MAIVLVPITLEMRFENLLRIGAIRTGRTFVLILGKIGFGFLCPFGLRGDSRLEMERVELVKRVLFVLLRFLLFSFCDDLFGNNWLLEHLLLFCVLAELFLRLGLVVFGLLVGSLFGVLLFLDDGVSENEVGLHLLDALDLVRAGLPLC